MVAIPAVSDSCLSQHHYDVLIIGAGLAGLSTTKTLLDRRPSLRVLVLEARDRVGGRVHSVDLSENVTIDLGAQYFHGDGDDEGTRNPMVELAEQLNIPALQLMQENFWWAPKLHQLLLRSPEEGRGFSEATMRQAFALRRELLASFAEDAIELLQARHECSARDVLEQALQDRGVDEHSDVIKAVRWIFGLVELWEGGELDLVSGYDMFGEANSPAFWGDFGGAQLVFPDGMQQIPMRISDAIGPGVIEYGCVVEKIESYITEDNDAKAGGSSLASVRTRDGRVFHAEHIVCTVPIGVLQQRHSRLRFEPALPLEKSEVIDLFMTGSYVKVFFLFETAFWDEHVRGVGVIGSQFRCWHAQGNMLVASTSGDAARSLQKRPCDADVIAETLAELRQAFAADLMVPEPIATRMTRWDDDEFSLGAYPFCPLQLGPDDIATVSEPVGRLHFAGDCTHVEYVGSTVGAYLSGIRAAKECLAGLPL